ncbi:MAG: SOS response-associated peptidase [Candidatus Binatia bacterium]
MCGRFVLASSNATILELFGLTESVSFPRRYNIAPGQNILAVRQDENRGTRAGVMLRWGLVPSWTASGGSNIGIVNARSETVAEKRSFRDAFNARRCLVPADGYYEWQRRGKHKQAHFVYRASRAIFAMAGIWNSHRTSDGEIIETCAILTTAPNDLVSRFHDRMPLIIGDEDYPLWLNSKVRDTEALGLLMRPFPSDELASHPVSSLVNDNRHDSPRCIERSTEKTPVQGRLFKT